MNGMLDREVSTLRLTLRTWEGSLGAVLLAAVLVIIIFGPLLAPYDPVEVGVGRPLSGMSAEHWLGTDDLGRDVLSRFLAGGRRVLLLPLVATVVAYVLGGLIAMLSTLKGGLADSLAGRLFDTLLVMPPMLLGLVALSGSSGSDLAMFVLLSVVALPRAGRFIRGASHAAARSEYVLAAVGRAEKQTYIVRREVFPNIALPVLADFGVRLTQGIVFASSLSYLGFGVQPPTPDWGRMVADSMATVQVAPLVTIGPAIGICMAALAANLLAEGVGRVMSGSRSV